MTAVTKPTFDALAAENAALKQALRLQALAPKICLVCLHHTIRLDALVHFDRPIGIAESD